MKDLPTPPMTVDWLGTSYRTILTRQASAGAMSIVDSEGPPGSGPPRHIHDREDESFVVLTGQLEFWLEGQRFVRGPGETAFVPRGHEHTFRVIGTVPSRHLVILTPGGFEGFFADMAQNQCRIPEDMPMVLQSAAAYGLRFTGPPLSD